MELILSSHPEQQGTWTKFGFRDTFVRIDSQSGTIEITVDGKLQRSHNLRDLESLSYTIEHEVETWHDSVRDRDCEIDNYTYIARIELKDFDLKFVSTDARYDTGITHRLHALPYLQQLSAERNVSLALKGMDHAPNFQREPEFQDEDYEPPQGLFQSLFRFVMGS